MPQETFNLKKGVRAASKGLSVFLIIAGLALLGFMCPASKEGIGIAIVLGVFGLAGIGLGILLIKGSDQKSSFVIISDKGINVANRVIISFSDITKVYEKEVVVRSRGVVSRKMHMYAEYYDQAKDKEISISLFNEDYEGYPYMREKVLKNVGKLE